MQILKTQKWVIITRVRNINLINWLKNSNLQTPLLIWTSINLKHSDFNYEPKNEWISIANGCT